MKIGRKIQIVLLVLLLTVAFAQDSNTDNHKVKLIIPQVALLDIESAGSNDIELDMEAPTEAGDKLAEQTDNSLWLNVTSIVSSGNDRDISVKIDNAYAGIDLKVVAAGYSGLGFGGFGSPESELTLTDSDQDLVTGITSGFTVDGATNGYQLTYTAEVDEANFENLLANGVGTDITVTYTLTP